ncbi:MAG: FAD-dependent oxidoreductase [Myxococcota bacterium]
MALLLGRESSRGVGDDPARAAKRVARVVVVGAGMAAQRFCERFVELGLLDKYALTVLGAEPHVPYDRIRLGELIGSTGALSNLAFREPDWYAAQGISLRTGTEVAGIDRRAQTVVDTEGNTYPYDQLVLATGSAPRVPACVDPSCDAVCVYRDADDAKTIADRIARGAPSRRVLVLGAGLLGIELAATLRRAGCEVRMYEAASHLLSRQLDVDGASVLLESLTSEGIDVRFGVRVASVNGDGEGVAVCDEDGQTTRFDFVVVAAGVRPRDGLATQAGLSTAARGGVLVNRSMRTSDKRIFAVGECANVDGEPFGLVAPCYETVETLVRQFVGRRKPFRRTPTVTKLKYDRLPTSVVGDALVDERGFESIVQSSGGAYRRLVLRRGRLVGATAVGTWQEWPAVLTAVVDRRRLRAGQRSRFEGHKSIWRETRANDVSRWAPEVPICTCTGATCGSVREAIADGCTTVGALAARTGAGTVCGSCTPMVESLLEPSRPHLPPRAQSWLAAVGVAALIAILTALLSEPVGWSHTFQNEWRVDALWRNKTLRQVTGFTLAGLCAISLVLSLRKRLPRFQLGHYRAWRLFHSTLGVATLAAVGVHTGFRFGSNLNFWLMVTFIVLAALGGLTAIAAAFEHHLPDGLGGVVRRRALLVHQILFWPFPVLVFVHALKSFYF